MAVSYFNSKSQNNFDVKQTLAGASGLEVSFAPYPVVPEEEIIVSFQLPSTLGLQVDSKTQLKAWIEGVNMYMGRSPVIIENSLADGAVQGVFFLGSCSEPKMHWRLYIQVSDTNGEQSYYETVDFYTEQTSG